MHLVQTVLLGLLAGPLLVAGVAKLVADPARIAWPYATGPLAQPLGPRVVAGGELVVAVVLLAAPALPAAVVATAAYAALTVVAYRGRGVPCACFGVARLAAIGRFHVVLNGSAALVGAVVAATAPLTTGGGSPAWLRVATALVSSAGVLGAVTVADRSGAPGAGSPEASTARTTGPILSVRLFVSENCPACRSLQQHLLRMEPARRDAVEVVTLGTGDTMPPELERRGVPSALAYGADGALVREPATGISDVNAVVDGITLQAVNRVDGG